MRWVRRVLFVLLCLVVAAVAVAGWLYWQATREPDFLAGAPAVSPAEAAEIVAKLTADPAPPAASPAQSASPAPGESRPRPRPYEISLSERDVAAVVLANAPPAFRSAVSGLRVRIRERDLVAAGTIRQDPLVGQTAWIDVRPSAGRGGALCLRFGRLHLGRARVPDAIIEDLAGGRRMPRMRCVSHRRYLPGPLRSARIRGGRVVLRGTRR